MEPVPTKGFPLFAASIRNGGGYGHIGVVMRNAGATAAAAGTGPAVAVATKRTEATTKKNEEQRPEAGIINKNGTKNHGPPHFLRSGIEQRGWTTPDVCMHLAALATLPLRSGVGTGGGRRPVLLTQQREQARFGPQAREGSLRANDYRPRHNSSTVEAGERAQD